MTDLVEIRWHARAGQGAKTAAHLLATGFVRSGSYAQAFPEYGPERRGAPLRAFTRASSLPIRRHDSVTHPQVVVVLEPSLVHEVDVADGLVAGGTIIVNATETPPKLVDVDVRCVDATHDVNLVMLGAAARILGAPPLEQLEAAALELLGKKADPAAVRAALAEGFSCPI